MPESNIKRESRSTSFVLASASESSTTLRLGDMSGGIISLGTMHTASGSLQMWGSVEESGPFRRLYKADGSTADITLAPSTADGRLYSLPDEIFAVPFLRIVAGAAQATGAIGSVSFKS